MAADLRGGVLGAASHVAGALGRHAVRPIELWAGVLAGPLAFACVLTVKYAAAQWACQGHRGALQAVSLAGAAVTVAAGWLAWRALGRLPATSPTDGGDPFAIARFMALLGIASSSLFVIVIVATGIPEWVLGACR